MIATGGAVPGATGREGRPYTSDHRPLSGGQLGGTMRKAPRLPAFSACAATAAAVLAGLAGCGTAKGDGTGSGSGQTVTPSRPRVSAAATLAPDGTVPWVEEPAVDGDFARPTVPPAPATGPTCRASQLNGVLGSWIHKSTGGEVRDPVMDASLYGFAVLTNTSGEACTLHGIPEVRLSSGGKALRFDHTGSTGGDAVVGLPPGGKAHFRLDWGAPFCPGPATAAGPYALVADLKGTGEVPVRLADPAVPGCAHDNLHPEVRSFLSPGPVKDGDVHPNKPATSALSVLTARAGDVPEHVRPGGTVDFTVTLSNPTAKAVPLTGRPGGELYVLCKGDVGEEGLSSSTSYLLNNRPVHGVPAHGSVRFAVRARIPAAPAFPGPELDITWRLLDRGYPPDMPYVLLRIPTGA